MGLVVFLFYYASEEDEMQEISASLHKLEKNLSMVKNHHLEFLLSESKSDFFYIRGESEELFEMNNEIDQINEDLVLLLSTPKIDRFGLIDDFKEIRDDLSIYRRSLNEIESKIRRRGHENFGLIGEFREYIHTLEEDFHAVIPISTILQLRRKEKDYILRGDQKYANELLNQCDAEITRISKTNSSNIYATKLLKAYANSFAQYLELDKEIGRGKKSGLRKDLYSQSYALIDHAFQLNNTFSEKRESYLAELKVYVLLTGLSYAIGLIVLMFASAKIISQPLKRLSRKLERFVNGGFEKVTVFPPFDRNDEIGKLQTNVYALQVEIADHFTNFRESAKQRESDLEEQKEKLEIQKFLLRKSRNSINEKNKLLLQSISYASRIQNSVFPSNKKLIEAYPDSCFYQEPLETICGDFFWHYENDEFSYFALADCTGHGVPGAFMSVLGLSFLNFAVNDKSLEEPNEILDYLNRKVTEVLSQEGEDSEVKDGMDIGLIRFEKGSNKLLFSGAQINLNILRNGKLVSINGDRVPIGWIYGKKMAEFTKFSWLLEEGDKIIIFSDGLTDQFGGDPIEFPEGKKLKLKRVKEVIHENSTCSTIDLSNTIQKTYVDWKRDWEQTDDVSFAVIDTKRFTGQQTGENIIQFSEQVKPYSFPANV